METPERKQELTRLFAESPGVTVLLQVPGGDEKSESTADSATSTVPPAETGPEGGTGLSPLKDHLLAHFARLDIPAEVRRARMVEYSNQVISLSQSAYLHAWELRRLVDRSNKMTLENASLSAQSQNSSPWLRIICGLSPASSAIAMRCFVRLWLRWPTPKPWRIIQQHPLAAQEGNWPSRSMRVFESVITCGSSHSRFVCWNRLDRQPV